MTLAGVPARSALLGRLSPVRDWLAHPTTRERSQPVLSEQDLAHLLEVANSHDNRQ